MYKFLYIADPPKSDHMVLHSVFPDFVEPGSYFDEFDWYIIRIDPDNIGVVDRFVLDHIFEFDYSEFLNVLDFDFPF